MIPRLAGVFLVVVCVGCAATPIEVHADFAATQPPPSVPTASVPVTSVPEAPVHMFAPQSQQYPEDLYAQSDLSASRRAQPKLQWSEGQALMQGYLGSSTYSTVSVADGDIDGDDGDLDTLPVIGGGAQWKIGGERIDFGFEGLLAFSGAANATAIAVGGGGTAVAVSVDMFIFELFGGPFVSVFLGEKLRLYGSAGPLMQWANYDQDSSSFVNDNGSGFGSGWYARTGFEFALASRTLLGFGVRWSDTSVDLGGDLNDLDMEGFQWMVTVSQGL